MTILITVCTIIVVITLIFASIYNKLIARRNRMQEGWSGIDVYLKKRSDLIPNLVETVKGYAKHESSTLEQVTALRATGQKANSMSEKIETEKRMDKAIFNIFAIAERYPDLKANQNFMALQQQLSSLEEEIGLARRYYNGTVREYNIVIQSFPSNIVANMFDFEKGSFYEISETDRENPTVSFN